MTQPFYKPRPVAPENNRQMKGLRWSLRVSVAGWIVYGAFAYAFADVGIIPDTIQSWMVLIGSALIVAGAESNTIATTEAALSKLGTDRISAWDFSAVIASLIGGIFTPLITFSTRQPEMATTWWRQMAVRQGPLILGVAGVFDFYGAVTELALAKRDHMHELKQWLKDKAEWDEANGNITLERPATTELVFDPSWPKAEKPDFLELLDKMNGQRTALTDDKLLRVLHKNQKNPPHKSTRKRWLQIAKRGE